jgi:hypothetical protein
MLPPCVVDYDVTANYVTCEAVYKPRTPIPPATKKVAFSPAAPCVLEYSPGDSAHTVQVKVRSVFGHVRRRPTPTGPKPTWLAGIDDEK